MATKISFLSHARFNPSNKNATRHLHPSAPPRLWMTPQTEICKSRNGTDERCHFCRESTCLTGTNGWLLPTPPHHSLPPHHAMKMRGSWDLFPQRIEPAVNE